MKKEGIFGSIKGFFEESEEELKEDIKEAEELIKEKKAKLKDAKKKTGFFSKLFEESEEEIKEEIKEAEELIKEKKKQLESLKEHGGKTHKKEQGKDKEKAEKKGAFSWIIIALIVVGILLIIIGFIQSANVPGEFVYNCEEKDKDPCSDCPFAINCVQLEEITESDGNLHFELENREESDKECNIKLKVVKDGQILEAKTYSLGTVEGLKSVKTKVAVNIPHGDTDYVLEPICD